MVTIQQRTPSRLFNSSEYRLFSSSTTTEDNKSIDDNSSNALYPTPPTRYVVMFRKRSRNRQQDVTYIRQKSSFITKAAASSRLEFVNKFQQPYRQLITCDNDNEKQQQQVNFLAHLPKETSLQILGHLDVNEIIQVAKTCRLYRLLAYDNMLWKQLCHSTWYAGDYMSVDITSLKRTFTSWYNWNASDDLADDDVLQLFQSHSWRLNYISMRTFETIPSIHHPLEIFFASRPTECFPTKRTLAYTCSLGVYTLKGCNQASFVEYVVFNNQTRAWHRRQYSGTSPIPIYSIRDYGLKLARTPRGQHNGEFMRRRGYYLKTDLNRKVHVTYRYYPTIRFRLYKQLNRVFLLCQDVFLSSGETVDCYTMYEFIKDEEDSVAKTTSTKEEHQQHENVEQQNVITGAISTYNEDNEQQASSSISVQMSSPSSI